MSETKAAHLDADEIQDLEVTIEPADEALEASSEAAIESEDSLTFSNGVIEKIVAIAMRDVPGVVGMRGNWFNRVQGAFGVQDSTKGVTVEVTPESAVKVNISVLIEFGAYAPQVFEDTKKAVVREIARMTGLEVAGVNLRIEDVLTEEEIERRNRRHEAEREAAYVVEDADVDEG